ncbi:MAG: phage major capsid protein [Phycisphaerae bacterium]|nr:phage major capsid protein [Phycisphaerae bacterium]
MKSASELQHEKVAAFKQARTVVDKAKTEERELSADEQRTVDDALADMRVADMEQAEIELSKSTGRVTGPMDDTSVRTLAPGELRFLKPEQRLTSFYPQSDSERGLNLGKLLGLAAGRNPDNADVERRTLVTYLDASGGVTLSPAVSADIWDAARAQSVIFKAGAVTLDMPAPKMILPKLTTDPAGSWKPEGQIASEDTVVFGGLELQARTMFFYLPISDELWQDCGTLSSFLEATLATCAALELDRAALSGTGTGEQPLGILNNVAITQTACTANPWDDVSGSMSRIEAANHAVSAMVMSPRTAGNFRVLKNGDSEYITAPVWAPKAFVTSNIPDTISTDKSAVIVGDFSNLIVGIRSSFRLEVLREARRQYGEVVIACAMRADIGVVRAASIDVIKDIPSTYGQP